MANTLSDTPSAGLRTSGLPHFLDRKSLFAALVLVGIPNVIFLAVSPWFLVRRLFSPLVYLIAALIAMFTPWPVYLGLFIAASFIDAVLIVTLMFDMPFDVSLHALRYYKSIDVGASALFSIGFVYFLCIPIVLTLIFRWHKKYLRQASLIPTIVLAFLAVFIDWKANGFKPLTKPKTFESAIAQTDITAASIAEDRRGLLVVLVEGMGAFRHEKDREILAGRLRRAAEGRYAFSSGTSLHYGSTTGATAREFCGVWATYLDYMYDGRHDCLPNHFTDLGYETAAYHAGYGALFSRRERFPRMGFQKLNFLEDMEQERPDLVTERCGLVFSGLCDRQIGDVVHADLKSGTTPKMTFWLTLNTHHPYVPKADGILGCDTAEPAIPEIMACELTELWIDVFDKVAEIATDPEMPAMDILVVGDHGTPMYSRKSFNHFVNGKVDWYYLRRQAEGSDMASAGLRLGL